MSMYIPKTLANGRYSVGDLIGHGGMAEVHLGTDTRLGRAVAIKIMRNDLATDSIFLTRFHREARSVAQMNNPNIVAIYDSGEEHLKDDADRPISIPYIVMEYVRGRTLRDIIKAQGALNQGDAEQIMLGMLNALNYSHRMGIVHRDIKPGNIMISEQGEVKVMDFGIARALDDSAATMTQNQGVVGTAQYLSPEQARGETVDMRSDLYSAGCVLYEMLTGQPPFTGDSAVAIAYQHVSEVCMPPSAVVPGLPKVWDNICAKAIAKDRANRYATATEFRNDILAVSNGEMPAAANFNPLVDLTQAKNKTQVLDPAAGETTQAFDPVEGEPNAFGDIDAFIPESDDMDDVMAQSRTDQRLEEEYQKKRKKRIIAGIIAAVLFVGAGVGAWRWSSKKSDKPQSVNVPVITEQTSSARAKELIEAAGLVFQEEQDTDSAKDKGTFTKQDPAGGTSVEKGSVVKVWFSAGPRPTAVPDVSNKSQDEARQILQNQGFKVSDVTNIEDSATVTVNNVTRTDPEAGQNIAKGSTITLYISSGKTSVPKDLVGKTREEASAALQKLNFNITIQEEASDTVEKGKVTRVNPAVGSSVDQRSMITLYISSGKTKISVPGFSSGMKFSEYESQLKSLGFNVKQTGSSGSNDTVVSTDPAPGTSADKGSTVTVTTKASEFSPSPSPSSSSSSSSSSSPSPSNN